MPTRRFNPNEGNELNNIIKDSYNDFVRIERRNLLAISTIIFILSFAGVKDAKIVFFGISFINMGAPLLFKILTFICFYFFIAYIIYAYPNFAESKSKWKDLTSTKRTMSGNIGFLYNMLPRMRYFFLDIFSLCFSNNF